MSYLSMNGVLMGLLYIGTGVGLLAMFSTLYVWWTPLNEFSLMKDRKFAPILALSGAMLGFTIPMVTMMTHSIGWLDFFVWSVVAMVIQLALERVLRCFFPNQIQQDNCATGMFFLTTSVCVGVINAFSFIPR